MNNHSHLTLADTSLSLVSHHGLMSELSWAQDQMLQLECEHSMKGPGTPGVNWMQNYTDYKAALSSVITPGKRWTKGKSFDKLIKTCQDEEDGECL